MDLAPAQHTTLVASRYSRAVVARHSVWSVTLCLLFVMSCGRDPSTGPIATPTSIAVQGGAGQTGVVATTLGTPLSVIVKDATGNAVSGATVEFRAAAGSGTVSPSAANTNGNGIATATWTLGTVAGALKVTASVSGVSSVVFHATALAGAATVVVTTPDRAYIGQGDTIRIAANARDQYGNNVEGQAITFSAPDASIATVNGAGLVAGVSQGVARIIAASGGKSTTVQITVGAPGSSNCGPLPVLTLAVGEVITPDSDAAGARVCLMGPAGVNAEYALTLISTAPLYSTVVPIDVFALGNRGPLTAAETNPLSAQVVRADTELTTVLPTAIDGFGIASSAQFRAAREPERFEVQRRATERRELTALVSAAREWRAASHGIAALAAAAPEPKVGDVMTLNTNAIQACSAPNNRPARVAAVGTRSVVVADNENPSGGYTDAEYASIAATFDTLIYPLDTTAFGAPSNVSVHGKILLFFTRSVNALTPVSTNNFTIGGFFFSRDLYPKVARNGLGACAGSNEAEMFYLLVPDPNGEVNSNKRTKDNVTTLNLGTIAHEFEHLINAGRRLYVNTSATPNEETWLDEGLAHTAEELLYYRVSGFTSRQNLNLSQVSAQPANFSNYASQNFSRLYQFLINPELNSPYAPNDSLATRGATWHFLRFAAGRQSALGEPAFYRALVNSQTTGRTNLTNVLGGSAQFATYLRDWTVSIIADDYSTATTAALDARYIMPSWNFRSIFPGLRIGSGNALGVYPINSRSLLSGAPQRITLAGGTSSYVRFALLSGNSSYVSLASNGAALPTDMRYAIVRLR